MRALRLIAAALTVLLGVVVAVWALRFEFALADGDGGFISPGVALAVILGGSPIVTGIAAIRSVRRDGE
ncbi:MAG: hypothetical protein EBR15_03995 [Gammaproteobacteria bacterium]|jgi:Na+/phosphate symporter|nr:hypothetical protein [Gammaproteobacteria bacterium]NBX40578.1 hypothetical protein [Gammaproteobacteria bacterium]